MNSSREPAWWGRMSTLWLMLVPLCCAIYTLLLPIAPNDFWYHVRAGAWICENGKLPQIALFSASVPTNTPYFYQSWISEIVLYKVLAGGGLAWIEVLRTVCLTLSFGLVQWACWRQSRRYAPALPDSTRARLTALVTLLAFAMCASNMDIRPQTLSVPLFCFYACCFLEWPFLSSQGRWKLALGLPLLMVLWVNTHGAFFTGLALLLVFTVGELLQFVLARQGAIPRFFGAAAQREDLPPLLVMAALGVMATLINPRGFGIYAYVRLLAQLEANQKFIQEWQAPTFHEWYGALFFISLFLAGALLVVLWAASRRAQKSQGAHAACGLLCLRLSTFLVAGALAVMAFRDIRSIIWFALFLAPLLAGMSSSLLPATPKEEPPVPLLAQYVNAIIALLLVAAPFAVLPWFKAGLPIPPEFAHNFTATPRAPFPRGFPHDPPLLLDKDTPVRAVAALEADPPRGRLWNDFVYGSYLAWASGYAPRLAPHADPRVEMHSLKFWEQYGYIAEGKAGSAQWLKAQNFTDALLDEKEQKKLIRHLKSAGWRSMFRGGGAIWLRYKGRPATQNMAE